MYSCAASNRLSVCDLAKSYEGYTRRIAGRQCRSQPRRSERVTRSCFPLQQPPSSPRREHVTDAHGPQQTCRLAASSGIIPATVGQATTTMTALADAAKSCVIRPLLFKGAVRYLRLLLLFETRIK